MARSRKPLESLLDVAGSRKDRALAHYNLAVFHYSNAREILAIPHYRLALRLGLPVNLKLTALAWLASSLYKTNQSPQALRAIRQCRALGPPSGIASFLDKLESRIDKKRRR